MSTRSPADRMARPARRGTRHWGDQDRARFDVANLRWEQGNLNAPIGLTAAGAKLQSVQAYGARDPRRVPPPNDPLVGAHVDDLLAAEGLVAAFSAFPGTGPESQLDASQIERIRLRITELNERWQATGPGEVLRLRWPGESR